MTGLEEGKRLELAFSHVRRQEGSYLQATKLALTRRQIYWHLHLGFPASITVRNKSWLFQAPQFNDIFVIAARNCCRCVTEIFLKLM